MDWRTRWQPLALVLVGVWLVYASITSKTDDGNEPFPPSDAGTFES